MVIRPSRVQLHGLWGFLTVVAAAVLVRTVLADGPPALIVILALAVLALVAVWIAMARSRDVLVVGNDAVWLTRQGTEHTPPAADRSLTRAQGDRLVFVWQGTARARHVGLTNTSGQPVLNLMYFKQAGVQSACEAAGWRFGDDDDRQRIVAVLDEVAERLGAPDAVLTRASFADAAQAVAEVRAHRDAIAGGAPVGVGVTVLFAPTGPLQEAAIDSGWGDRFVVLGAEVDAATANLLGGERRP